MESSSQQSTGSSPTPSFKTGENNFLRSISTREPSFSQLPLSPVHISSSSAPSSPPPSLNPSKSKKPIDKTQSSSYKCISSMLRKDGQILSIAISNGLVYTGFSQGQSIRIWKLPEFTECSQLKSKAGMVCALAVSNDKVFAAYSDCKIRVWRRTFDGTPTGVRFEIKLAKIGHLLRNYIGAGKERKMMKHSGPITSLAVNTSDDLLYSASFDKTVKVWRISDLKCVETIQAHSHPINAIVVGDDGVIYTASDDATVRVWHRNFCSGDRPHSLTVTLQANGSPVKALALNTDGCDSSGGCGGVLYGGCTDGYIHYWLKGWFSGQLHYGGALQGHTHAVLCLSNVANFVVSGSADWTSRVWVREQEGQHACLAVLQGHRAPIKCVTVFTDQISGETEDECTVCTGSLDGVLKVWRVTCTSNAYQNSLPTGHEYFQL